MNIIRISKDIYKIVIIKECHLSALKSPFGLLCTYDKCKVIYL